jgi:hypothetical protein
MAQKLARKVVNVDWRAGLERVISIAHFASEIYNDRCRSAFHFIVERQKIAT